jgi:hypothetical protein
MWTFAAVAIAASIPKATCLAVGSGYVKPRHRRVSGGSLTAGSEREREQSASDAETELLHSWLQNGGSLFPKVKVGRCPKEGGLGVFATQPIAPGDVVLELPLSMCLVDWESTSDLLVPSTFKACTIGAVLPADVSGRLTWTTRLAAALLAEKSLGLASRFHPHLALLSPEPPPNLPHRFVDSATVSKEAQSKWFEASVDTNFFRAFTLRDELEDAMNEVLTDGSSSLDTALPGDFSWAVDTIQSRTFRFELEDGGTLRVLAPFFDCFNYRSGSQSDFELVHINETAMLRLSVGDKYAIGDQVAINYGGKTSDDFCLYYGFFPAGDNLHAAAEVHGGLSPPQLQKFHDLVNSTTSTGNQKLLDGLATLLSELTAGAVSNAYMKLALHPNDLDDLDTLVSVAVAVASATEAVLEAQGELYDVDQAAALLLADRMRYELMQFPTTASQDASMLVDLETSGSSSDSKKMMVQLRLQKKQVLQRFETLFSEFAVVGTQGQYQELFERIAEKIRLDVVETQARQ